MEPTHIEADQDFLDTYLEGLSPEIYRKNAFRILQLTTQASNKEIQKRQQIIEIASRTGSEIPSGTFPILALTDPVPDAYQVSEAFQKLSDPQNRLLDELFWFWPEGSKIDAGSRDDGQAPLAGLIDQWTEEVGANPRNSILVHNLAVLYHASALDIELVGLDNGVQERDSPRLQSLWNLAYKYWNQLLCLDEFWDELTRRIREYEDPRLTTGTSRRLRSHLPKFISRIHAQLAIRYFDKSKPGDASRNLSILRSSGFPGVLVDESLKWAVEPVRQRIKSFIGQDINHSNGNLAHTGEHIQNLLNQGIAQLNILDWSLPQSDLTRSSAHDEFALGMLSIVEDYFDKAEQCREALKLLSTLAPIAYTPSAKEPIQKQIDRINEVQASGNYWCSEGYYNLAPDIFQVFEQARAHVRQGQLDQAIQAIENLLTVRSSGKSDVREASAQALALCYNQKAVGQLNAIVEILDSPRSVIKMIIQRVQQENPASLATINAISSGNLEYYGRRGMVFCMACGMRITQAFYRFQYNDLDMLVCSGCNQADENERSRRMQTVSASLSQVVSDLIYCQELNPNNHAATKNLQVAREIALNLGIQVPTSSGRSRLISGKPPQNPSVSPEAVRQIPTSRPIQAQPTRKADQRDDSKVGWIYVVVGVIVLCILGAIGATSGGAINSSRISTSIPTKMVTYPTNAPVIRYTATSLPPTKKPKTPTPITPFFLEGCFSTTTNVRSGPGTNYTNLGYFNNGDCIPITGVSSDRKWYQIEALNPSGVQQTVWVYAKNVTVDTSYGSVNDLPVVRYP